VAQRISEQLRDDGQEPSISIGARAAIFPQDGKTINELLAAADRALYREQRAPKRLQSTRPISDLDGYAVIGDCNNGSS